MSEPPKYPKIEYTRKTTKASWSCPNFHHCGQSGVPGDEVTILKSKQFCTLCNGPDSPCRSCGRNVQRKNGYEHRGKRGLLCLKCSEERPVTKKNDKKHIVLPTIPPSGDLAPWAQAAVDYAKGFPPRPDIWVSVDAPLRPQLPPASNPRPRPLLSKASTSQESDPLTTMSSIAASLPAPSPASSPVLASTSTRQPAHIAARIDPEDFGRPAPRPAQASTSTREPDYIAARIDPEDFRRHAPVRTPSPLHDMKQRSNRLTADPSGGAVLRIHTRCTATVPRV